MGRSSAILVACLLMLAAAFAIKGAGVYPPAPPENVHADAFDTQRAMGRLSRILGDQSPHPVDSAAGDGVRDRIVAELLAMGITPRIDDGMACNEEGRTVSCARVRNILFTLGSKVGAHLLVGAHYDSTPVGPGAADDGIGVASLLEMAAILRHAPLRRPVTFLIDDGEEAGLIGARAFLDRDPLAAQVDSVINMESRGTEGPAIMFETNSPNGAAIATYAASSRRPAANSLSADFAKLIPNSTDVRVFKERGWITLNFAIIGNETRYHSPNDRIENLSPASVYHMGSQALAAARLMAGAPGGDISAAHGGEMAYADLLQHALVAIPLPLAIGVLIVLLMAASWWGWRVHAIGRPLLLMLGAVLLSTLVAALLCQMVGLIRAGDYWRASPWAVHLASQWTAIAVCAGLLLRFGPAHRRESMRAANWLLFLAFGALASLVAPGASIFFLLPPIIALAGALLSRRVPAAGTVAQIVAALLLFLTMGPLLSLIEMLLVDGPLWITAPLASLLALPFLIECVPLAERASAFTRWVAGCLALIGWIITLVVPAYSPARQERMSIELVTDMAKGRSIWAVNSARSPAGILSANGGWTYARTPYRRMRWTAPAPTNRDTPLPSVTKIIDSRGENERTIALRIAMNGASSVQIFAAPEARMLRAGFASSIKPFGDKARKENFQLRCSGRACDGETATIVTSATGPLDLIIVGQRPSLPAWAASLTARRPWLASPQYSPDATIAWRRIKL